jgi:hypothetical protein
MPFGIILDSAFGFAGIPNEPHVGRITLAKLQAIGTVRAALKLRKRWLLETICGGSA